MYSKLLDDETLSRVIAAAPEEPVNNIEALARAALAWLHAGILLESATVVTDRNTGLLAYMLSLKDLAATLEHFGPTPKAVGRAIHELGLKTIRKRDGYYVIYSERQIEILRAALEVTSQEERVVVVEGQADVVSLGRSGIAAVALEEEP